MEYSSFWSEIIGWLEVRSVIQPTNSTCQTVIFQLSDPAIDAGRGNFGYNVTVVDEAISIHIKILFEVTVTDAGGTVCLQPLTIAVSVGGKGCQSGAHTVTGHPDLPMVFLQSRNMIFKAITANLSLLATKHWLVMPSKYATSWKPPFFLKFSVANALSAFTRVAASISRQASTYRICLIHSGREAERNL